MKKYITKTITLVLSILVIALSANNIHADKNIEKVKAKRDYSNTTIKVGFYNYNPYFYINDDGLHDGYYNKLLKIIAKELNFKYEYIDCDVNEVINALTTGKVDLLLGINRTTERLESLIYTDHNVAIENYGIYTNKDIIYGNLDNLDGLNFGYIENEANSEWILGFLNTRGIKVNLVKGKSYEELNSLLIDGKVDATISTLNNHALNEFKVIFEFSAGPVYITARKGNESLINDINYVFEKYGEMNPNPIDVLYEQYFNKYAEINNNSRMLNILLFWVIFVGIFLIIYKTKIPNLQLKRKQSEIRDNLDNNNYLLHYQPIINPKTDETKGFEALLRMKSGDKILTPYFFIKDIEDNSMMHEVSIWILKKAICDYKIIKEFECVNNNNFYISINVSFKEIEDEVIVNDFVNIAKEYKVKPNTICLEIVEKVAMKDVLKIKFAISKLQQSGYLVAIDDFGVEYSNLDILEKLDCNIVKIDKYFVDNIEESIVRREIVKFISHLCKISNKVLISEGVEDEEQKNIIKEINNDKFYIQGYYYSKPLDISELKNFKI